METYKADTISYIYHTDSDNEVETHIWFTVDKAWAENWVEEQGDWESLEDFDGEYTWDSSLDMYEAALEEDAIIEVEYRKSSCDADPFSVGNYPHTKVTGEAWNELLAEWDRRQPNMNIDDLISLLQKAKEKGVKEVEFQVYKWQMDLEDTRYHLAYLDETRSDFDTLTIYID